MYRTQRTRILFFTSLFFSLIFFSYNLSCQLLNPAPIAVYKSNNQWYAIDELGHTLWTSKDFLDIEQYSEGLLGTYLLYNDEIISAYYDNSGEIKVVAQSRKPLPFKNGRAFTIKVGDIKKNDYSYGLIDRQGNEILPKQFIDIEPFSEGLAYIMNLQERGYIDTNGKFVFKLEKGIAGYGFSEGLSPVSDSKIAKFGYVNKKGELVIGYKFDEAGQFSEGLARVFTRNIYKQGGFGFINKSGIMVIDNLYEETSKFKESRVFVAMLDSTGESFAWAVLNDDGVPLTSFIYADCKDFSNGLAAVKCSDGFWKYIDRDVNFIDDNSYKYCGSFVNNKAFVITKDDKKIFISKSGNPIIDIPTNAEIVLDCRNNERWEIPKTTTPTDK
jgi:hypothetical protein